MIKVDDYHKTYRETVAVEGLSFEVGPGEILGLVGPNGAGKTTTLRAICGIIPPTKGQLFVAGCDIVENPVEAKRQIAFIPDDPHLFDTLTVWEHLKFVASAYRVENYEEKGAALLKKFELEEKRNALAQELSRGMRQKTAICCAYLHDPKALLFDEPLTGLDPRGIRTLNDTIVEKSQAGAAIVISSHLLSLVEDLCTHLLIMHKGKKLFSGSIAEARSAFGKEGADSTLEELFFRATEGEAEPAAAVQE
ncbi:MAG: ABC transporter ATP-binding protein [Candidatus Omnitrophota bacterium]